MRGTEQQRSCETRSEGSPHRLVRRRSSVSPAKIVKQQFDTQFVGLLLRLPAERSINVTHDHRGRASQVASFARQRSVAGFGERSAI
jgi:hypothetical protein